MKSLSLLTLLALVSSSAHAETLQFSASIQNEDLAEESILLLHCLAARSGSPWEFTGEAGGTHWLELREKGKAAEGKYRHGKDEAPVHLKLGEAESVCAQLLPGAPAETLLTPDTGLPGLSALPTAVSKPNYWPWALGAVAVAAAGYALLRSNNTHHGFTMN